MTFKNERENGKPTILLVGLFFVLFSVIYETVNYPLRTRLKQ